MTAKVARPDPKLGWRLLRLARPEARTLVIATLFLTVGSAMSLIYPQAVRTIIDEALSTRDMDKVNGWASIILGVSLLQAIAASVRYYLFTLAGERIVVRLREKLYGHILEQEIGFFDFNKTGELMSRLSADCSVLQNAVSVNISMALRNVAGAIGGLVLLVMTSPKLAALVLIVIPPVALSAGLYGRRISGFSRKAQDSLASAKEKIRQIGWFMGIASAFGYAAVAAVLWYGGHLVVSGTMTVGDLTQFLLYLMVVAFSVAALGGLWGDFMSALGAANRVFEILERKAAFSNTEGVRLPTLSGRIEFKDVGFNYPSRTDIDVLSDLSFAVDPGRVVALVGTSGSGKTTVASLLIRLYDPTSGEIRIDGTKLGDIEPNWLRRQVGIVSQEPILISASIEENIRYGNTSATHDEVLIAARIANAHDFISQFPQGYETLVGERGIQLSGGQKQRVAIARAVLKDPRILILDEATSALDTESEHLVQDALNKLMKGRTTLVIAHRLATIRSADLILVMERGRVLEMGTHDELVRRPESAYLKLINKQYFGFVTSQQG